ncbi:3-hydroxyacyl-ACP dehydratase FabZ family protein [Actinokineospora bangkokensis]|uniref:3-hydroxyacyl-ACP dehydratase n=1 Tax=Actinokineospora bangkokensis TaxID=1193682 RepID=A0A1Q9LIV3_9PSEU|nr:3-hydroxyacyl-ACP dehydratase [Actinokineospora bangkokensis]OLR91930.1 3-hydroxyacyl-ACP dehydratase [Actinokineospora bangkokensis]
MIGVEEIKRVIPHRYPILLVDRVDEVVPGQRLVARKAVTAAESCYSGTGGDQDPAYPLSHLLESWAQAAVLLACWEAPNPDVLAGKVELATGISGVRLGGPVLPGDVLVHRVSLVRAVDDAVVLAGTSEVDGREVLSVASFSAALRDSSVLTEGVAR